MPNQLPIPESFQHLIEKRDGEDRRAEDVNSNEKTELNSEKQNSDSDFKPRLKQRRKR